MAFLFAGPQHNVLDVVSLSPRYTSAIHSASGSAHGLTPHVAAAGMPEELVVSDAASPTLHVWKSPWGWYARAWTLLFDAFQHAGI
uniref:Transcriptional regulator n=1 Tax=Panagrellus redivivus TaxID=6233 RepID=A0A7E5A1V5_PANRE